MAHSEHCTTVRKPRSQTVTTRQTRGEVSAPCHLLESVRTNTTIAATKTICATAHITVPPVRMAALQDLRIFGKQAQIQNRETD